MIFAIGGAVNAAVVSNACSIFSSTRELVAWDVSIWLSHEATLPPVRSLATTEGAFREESLLKRGPFFA